MSYLADLIAHGSGVTPARALRPVPSFLRPPASHQWGGELAVEIDSGGPSDGGVPPGLPSIGIRGAAPEPATGPTARPSSARAEVTRDRQPASAAPAARAEPSARPSPAEASPASDAPSVRANIVAPATVPETALVGRYPLDPLSPTRELAVPVSPEVVPAAASENPRPPVAPQEIQVAIATVPAPARAVEQGLDRAFEPDPAPVVTVHIDRIDIVAPRPPVTSRAAIAPPRPAAPTLSLDAYLTRRSAR